MGFLGIKGKILLAFSATILLSILMIAFVVNLAVRNQVEQDLQQDLDRAALTFQSTQSAQAQNFIQKGRLLTRISFVKALVSSRETGGILEWAKDAQKKIQSAIFIVTDGDGQVIARTDTDRFDMNISEVPSIRKGLQGEEGNGLFLEGDQVYRIFTFPIEVGDTVLGTVSAGYHINDEHVRELMRYTGSNVTFITEGRVVASVWSGQKRKVLQDSIQRMAPFLKKAHQAEANTPSLDLILGSETFTTTFLPLRTMAGNIQGTYLIQASKDQAMALFRKTQRTILFLSIIALSVAIWVGYVVARQISRPMRDLTEATMRMARMEGDLTEEIPVTSRDEVGQLATSFNTMIKSFHGLVNRIREAGIKINSSSTEISAGAYHQAAGAAEQSSTVTQVSSAVEELSQTAGRIASNAQDLSKISVETLKGMREIKTKVDQVATRVLALGEKSQAIGNITKLIDELADRTNLLALNAAIEAARAGDVGHGFAVVASEVGKLAEQSASSTREIHLLIDEIQAETKATIIGVEDTSQWADKGLQMVGHTADVIKEISVATQDQKSSADEVVEAMTGIDKVTTSFASTTQQTAATATALAEVSAHLKDAIGGFRLGQSDNGKTVPK